MLVIRIAYTAHSRFPVYFGGQSGETRNRSGLSMFVLTLPRKFALLIALAGLS